LRTRAESLEAFLAFVDHYIGGVNMMAYLPQVQGDARDNIHSNYTSTNDIMYVNNSGFKIYQPITRVKLYLMPHNMGVDVNHTPALKKTQSGTYQMFVRTQDGGVSNPLDPADLDISTRDLDQLWNKRQWGEKTDSQSEFLPFTNKIMEKIITKGNHFQPEGDELHLAQEFIPQNATEIAYVYHKGYHFQALIPVSD
jgi:hypothetical protein